MLMRKRMVGALVLGVAWTVLSATSVAMAADMDGQASIKAELDALRSEVQELRAERGDVEALQAEVSQLRAETNEGWLNERRAEQVKTLIHDVLADADTRASLAGDGIIAGHNGKKFFLSSEDGKFLMKIEGQIQVRYIWNSRDEEVTDPDDDVLDEDEAGFEIRRAKIKFSGHIGDPKVKYALQLAVDRSDNVVLGEVMKISYDLMDGLTIWAGEDKAPFLKEEFTSSKRQLAVERSLVNETFTLDKVQGVGLIWKPMDSLKLQAMYNDGGKSGDGGGGSRVKIMDVFDEFDDEADDKRHHQDGTEYAFTGRVDWLITGEWKQYKDFTSFPGEELFAYLGGAIHYEANEVGHDGTSLDNDKFLMWTIDAGVEYQGLNVFVAFVMAHTDFDDGDGAASPSDYDPWGIVVQGGYNIDIGSHGSIEPFVRWERIDFDGAVSAGDTGISPPPDYEDEIDLLTVGLNWYHKKHASKFTVDVVWAFDGIPDAIDQSGLAIHDDQETQDDQVALRLQYQLLF